MRYLGCHRDVTFVESDGKLPDYSDNMNYNTSLQKAKR